VLLAGHGFSLCGGLLQIGAELGPGKGRTGCTSIMLVMQGLLQERGILGCFGGIRQMTADRGTCLGLTCNWLGDYTTCWNYFVQFHRHIDLLILNTKFNIFTKE